MVCDECKLNFSYYSLNVSSYSLKKNYTFLGAPVISNR